MAKKTMKKNELTGQKHLIWKINIFGNVIKDEKTLIGD